MYIKIALAVAIAAALSLGVYAIRQDAIADNEAVWEKRMSDMDEKANKVIDELRNSSIQLATTAQENTTRQSQAINAAVKRINKSSPAGTFVKPNQEGVCELTKDYQDSFREVRKTLP